MRRKMVLGALVALGWTAAAGAARADGVEAADVADGRWSSVFDTGAGLRPDDVVKRALTSSPALDARSADVEAAESTTRQAKIDLLPRVSGSFRYTRLSNITQPSLGNLLVAPTAGPGPVPTGTPLVNVPFTFPVILDQSAAQAQLTIPISDTLLRLSRRYAAAQRAEDAARHEQAAARALTAANARLAYYDWARARLQVVVAEQGLTQAGQHLVDAKSALATGSASKADVLRAESQVAASQVLVARAKGGLALAEEQLRTIAHDDALDLRAVGEDLRADPPAVDASGGVPRLVVEAARSRHELAALDLGASALDEQAKAARGGVFPRLDAFAEATHANPNQRFVPQSAEWRTTWSAGVVLSWSPNEAFGASAAGDALEARARAARAQRRALADQLRAEVSSAYEALVQTSTSLEAARKGLASAEEGHRVRTALYQAGRATSTEVTDAQTDLLRSRLALVDALIDARVARVRLLHATGRST